MLRFQIFRKFCQARFSFFVFLQYIGFKLKKRLIASGIAAVSVYGLYFTAYGLQLGALDVAFLPKNDFWVLVCSDFGPNGKQKSAVGFFTPCVSG